MNTTDEGIFPTYRWRWAPPGLATRRQLAADGLRPGRQPIAAQILWRRGERVAYLYRRDAAEPKRPATTAQLAALDKAMLARRTCPSCEQDIGYVLPRRWPACLDCQERDDTDARTRTDTDDISTTGSGEVMTENTPTPQIETGTRWRDITVTYPDGRQRDPYHLLDNWLPGLHRSPTWVNQQIKHAAMERADRDAVIAFAAQLDPTDTSDQAQHLREVADEARDHNTYYDQRAEWAAALLQADPTLADRIDPAARHDAEQLLHTEQAAQAAQVEQAADVEPVEATRDTQVDDATGAMDTADTGSDPVAQPMTRAQLADALWEGRLSPAEAERLDPRLAGMAEVLGMSEAEANTRTNHGAIDWQAHIDEDYSLDWQDQLAEDRAAIHDAADDDAWGA